MRPVVALFGPTASGKTATAVALAERAGGEVVAADAMGLYAGLPILTAQPTAAERARAPHRLVGVWPLDHEGAVGEYAVRAHEAIDELRADDRLAILAGGSGLYLRAALVDLRLPPRVDPATRAACERLYDDEGALAAHAELVRVDPAAGQAIHPNDRRRVVRGLELARSGSSLRPDVDRLWSEELRVPAQVFALDWPADELARRIEARTEAMLMDRALDEVRELLRSGTVPSSTARTIHGLAECIACVEGRLSLDECRARIVLQTRRYSRRQRVWLRRIPNVHLLAGADGPERNAERILETLTRP
ncbi:MAG: tRNA dimethylallyltransferase [Gaiellales bacterium]|nr:tRNA dimethylallyltransferase [Gaiellales bacterium]